MKTRLPSTPENAASACLPDAQHKREEVLKRLLDDLGEDVTGVSSEVAKPLAHLISQMVSGDISQITTNISGDDLDKLQDSSERVKIAHRLHELGMADGIGDGLRIVIRPVTANPHVKAWSCNRFAGCRSPSSPSPLLQLRKR